MLILNDYDAILNQGAGMSKVFTSIFMILVCGLNSMVSHADAESFVLSSNTSGHVQHEQVVKNNVLESDENSILTTQVDSDHSSHPPTNSHESNHQCHVGHCSFISVTDLTFNSPTLTSYSLLIPGQRAISVYLGMPIKPPSA